MLIPFSLKSHNSKKSTTMKKTTLIFTALILATNLFAQKINSPCQVAEAAEKNCR